MMSRTRRGAVLPVAWAVGTMLAAGLVMVGAGVTDMNRAEQPGDGSFVQPRLDATRIYEGNASCAGSGCHSGTAKKQSGRDIGDELTIWRGNPRNAKAPHDPHARAAETLKNAQSKKIAEEMKKKDPSFPDAVKAGRCLNCHATDAPEKQRGKEFGTPEANAVGCESCHGAGDKGDTGYNKPHQEAGWTDKQRAAIGAAGLKEKFGLIDTSEIVTRTQLCVSCHLKIEGDLVEAGHPPLAFEMYSYNHYQFNKVWRMHWDEPKDNANYARQWAVGQIVGSAAADAQAKAYPTDANKKLAKLYADGKKVAATAMGSEDPKAVAAAAVDKGKLTAAAAELAKSADAYKAGAENKIAREILASSVRALAAAAAGESEDLGKAAEEAMKAEGDAFTAAVGKLAERVK